MGCHHMFFTGGMFPGLERCLWESLIPFPCIKHILRTPRHAFVFQKDTNLHRILSTGLNWSQHGIPKIRSCVFWSHGVYRCVMLSRAEPRVHKLSLGPAKV